MQAYKSSVGTEYFTEFLCSANCLLTVTDNVFNPYWQGMCGPFGLFSVRVATSWAHLIFLAVFILHLP